MVHFLPNEIANEPQKWVWVMLIMPIFSLDFFASSTFEFYDLDSTTSSLVESKFVKWSLNSSIILHAQK